ncbi:MAG: DUF4145 domain-containing protein [Phycisphaerae bacterium]|nr:DUF4145 domain-containing protein [Phycisphaerae bacterium]
MASDIDRVVRASKRLEGALERRFGATGRGLHEKISSVEGELDAGVVRDLRFVATIRNKLLHEADYKRIDDRKAFRERYERAARAVEGRGGLKWMVVAAVLALLLVGIAVMWWVVAK